MMQQEKPDDFVLATGETHTVRRMCDLAFKHAGIEIEWTGEGADEKGINKATGKIIVEVDPQYFRPTEVDLLIGDPAKAKEKLGWNFEYDFEALVKEMVESDLEEVRKSVKV